MKQPKFQEMIEDIKSEKINKIIVYKLDTLNYYNNGIALLFGVIPLFLFRL